MTNSLLEKIEKENEALDEKACQMFFYWKQRDGFAATYKFLYEALTHDLVKLKGAVSRGFCLFRSILC